MLRQMLVHMGVEGAIGEAADGLEAIEKLHTQPYDLIICDINMPSMNGLEFLKWLRESKNYHDIPLLMITGEVSEDIVAAAAESDVDHYLLKPFQIAALENRILDIIRKKQHPSPGETIFRQAQIYKKAQKYERAIQEALKLCHPPYKKQARILTFIGECYLALGELAQANHYLTAALELNPRYLKTYKNYSALKEQTGELDEAIQTLQNANQLNPRNRERLLQLGKLFLKSGEPERAKQYVAQALKGSTKATPNLTKQAAELYLQCGLAAEAAALFNQSLKEEPRNVHLYNRLGIALRQQQKHHEALECYRQALEIDPHNEICYYNMGILYFDLGDKTKARAAFDTALRLRPHFPEAQEFLKRHFR